MTLKGEVKNFCAWDSQLMGVKGGLVERLTDRRVTDRQTDGQTDGQEEKTEWEKEKARV